MSDELHQHCQALAEQAVALTTDCRRALFKGDSEQAQQLWSRREQVIAEIPFSELGDTLPEALQQVLQQLHDDNEELSRLALEVRERIGEQLGRIKRGMEGSQTYHNIDQHR